VWDWSSFKGSWRLNPQPSTLHWSSFKGSWRQQGRLEGQYYIGYPFAFELALYDGDANVSTELLYEPRLHPLATATLLEGLPPSAHLSRVSSAPHNPSFFLF
jgi:hypothetical protein